MELASDMNVMLEFKQLVSLLLINEVFLHCGVYSVPVACTGECVTSQRSRHISRRQQKIEHIKQNILEKLGLAAPPDITISQNIIPTALLDDFYKDVAEYQNLERMKEKQDIKKLIILARHGKNGLFTNN